MTLQHLHPVDEMFPSLAILFFIFLYGYFLTLIDELIYNFLFPGVGAKSINDFKSLDVVEVIEIVDGDGLGLQ